MNDRITRKITNDAVVYIENLWMVLRIQIHGKQVNWLDCALCVVLCCHRSLFNGHQSSFAMLFIV